jgi:hypothetical protein
MKNLVFTLGLPLATLTLAHGAETSALPKVSFNRDIRPLMSDTCFHCHGFDAKTREAGLRLDIREEAIKETEEGALPIVPGDPDKSEIIIRLFDESDPMPPEKAHKPFTAAQKELFRRWVAEGAEYEPHWSYAELKRPEVPHAGAKSGNPIDAFIAAKLAEKKLSLSPAAAPHVLARRLSLDLTGLPVTGLPPTGEVALDYEARVDSLLASPHFGERMAVWWLDIARFADTVGFHGDQNQRIFPYRDYVINAFNSNKPFDVFTREQLAGDLLPEPTKEQLTATGYNRLNMMTREGGAQAKEYLAKYGAERVRSVAAAWFGSTFGCAECHDHKFDPIKARDFYELQSFFADVKQWGVYADYGYTPEPELKGVNNDSPFPPEIEVESPWMKEHDRLAGVALSVHLDEAATRIKSDPKLSVAREEWEKGLAVFLKSHSDGWLAPAPAEGKIVKDGKPVAERSPAVAPNGTVAADKALGKGESLEITLDPAGLSILASVQLRIEPGELDAKTIASRSGKALTLSLAIRDGKGALKKLSIRHAEATAKRPVYRGGEEVIGVQSEWRLPAALPEKEPLRSVWIVSAPVKLNEGDKVVATLAGDNLLPVKLSLSPLAAINPLETADSKTLKALATAASARGAEAAHLTANAFLFSTAADRAAYDTAHQLAAKQREFRGGKTWTMVTLPTDKPLEVRVLPRGNWLDETGPVVLPSTPSFLPGRLESTPGKRLTRLDLANWIVSDANPITARAVMNRLWAMFFGTGLSAVIDDLGSQGELPSHPELLDWLAVEFRESGWDVQHIVRLIVTSETYRQSSNLRPELKEVDPANRLLASQNPRRLEAEFVRDNALSIAGLLNIEAIGGPSVKPYQPTGYYEALQFPSRDYVADTDAKQWRRGLYTHWQRTFLHPMLANFDAPARDECAAARVNSNTPQQALTLLNDPAFVEAARGFAARLLADKAATTDEARLAAAYRIALNREPAAREVAALTAFLKTQHDHFAAAPAEAAKLLSIGFAPRADLEPVLHAAWTQVARVILNAHETITRY